jgi:hypothetical protein
LIDYIFILIKRNNSIPSWKDLTVLLIIYIVYQVTFIYYKNREFYLYLYI